MSRPRLARLVGSAAAADLALAVAVAVLATIGVRAEIEFAGRPVPPALPAYLLAVAAAACLLVRRRHPLAVAVTTVTLMIVYHLLGYPGGAPALAQLVAYYTLGAYGDGQRSLFAGGTLALVAATTPTLASH